MAKPKSVKETPTKAKKIVDVSRPNDTPSSETSKPVIISNRPLMRDPMMAAPDSEESPVTAPVKLPEPLETATPNAVKHERMIMPPGEAAVAESADPAIPAEPAPTMLTMNDFKPPQSETPAEPAAAIPPPSVKKPEIKPDIRPETKPDAPKPYTVTEAPSKKEEPLTAEAQEAKDAEEEEERLKQLDKMIEDGTYFLPVDSVNHKKAQRNSFVGLVLALVIGVVWFMIALDANLIQIDGIEAPTNFFSN